jgi:hypothetical protein
LFCEKVLFLEETCAEAEAVAFEFEMATLTEIETLTDDWVVKGI